ncbi:hypothetical protein H6P81_007270 [Aristolochia fimbriata]|uniref:Late embryogenesis abundant protein n=1 Tax=Aristolochia fimbriata TaxID=158543 RepID=A0AAV7F3E4_ARIFI|nr:hypothetical protein H6P81_007270 [Aristolochia fimbriata]
MAANLQRRGFASVGKRFVDGNWIGSFRGAAPASVGRRNVHTSVYDKNVDEQVRPTVVPDDVIEAKGEEYWAPNPKTGVFGPAAEKEGLAGGARRISEPGQENGSVLEEKVWFRPLGNDEGPQRT